MSLVTTPSAHLLGRARRTARRSGCSCRTRRVRRPRSAVHVQLAKRRSLCSRWMGAESSSATAAGAGAGRRPRRCARRRGAMSGARSASQRAVTAGSSGKSLSAARRDRGRVVVEREQRRVLVGDPGGRATTPSAIGRACRDVARQARSASARPARPSAAAGARASGRPRATPGSASARPTRRDCARSRVAPPRARLDREARVGLGDSRWRARMNAGTSRSPSFTACSRPSECA